MGDLVVTASTRDDGAAAKGAKWFFVLLAAAFALVIGLIIWAPSVTPFSELKREAAVVYDFDLTSNSPVALFLTSSGITIRCSPNKGRGCEPALMRSLRERRTPVELWHDGKKVYQLAVGGRVILPYGRVHDGRGFVVVLLIVIFMACCVRGAMYFGLFSNYPRGS